MVTRPELAETLEHESTEVEARQVVRAPDQVALHLSIAGPTSRMLAYAIDAIAVVLLEVGLLFLLILSTPLGNKFVLMIQKFASAHAGGPTAQQNFESALVVMLGIFLVGQFLVEWGYFVFWEMVTGGRSIGKAVVGLRVVRDGGFPLSFRESLVRNLLRMADILPGMYAVGLVSMVMSKEGKRLGDLAAGTIVVRLDRPEPVSPIVHEEGSEGPSFRFDRWQIDRLGTNERALIRQTLRRLDSLPPEKADAILIQAVGALRARIGYGDIEASERKAFLQALLKAAQRS